MKNKSAIFLVIFLSGCSKTEDDGYFTCPSEPSPYILYDGHDSRSSFYWKDQCPEGQECQKIDVSKNAIVQEGENGLYHLHLSCISNLDMAGRTWTLHAGSHISQPIDFNTTNSPHCGELITSKEIAYSLCNTLEKGGPEILFGNTSGPLRQSCLMPCDPEKIGSCTATETNSKKPYGYTPEEIAEAKLRIPDTRHPLKKVEASQKTTKC